MINTLQELLEDYARFSCMEDKIDPETSEELQKGAKDYLKQLNELNLLTIPVVIVSDFCECDGVQDLHAMTGECRKCGKECDY
jgi:hypothetical protein|tara:strand:+ start:335 stop:583 length:249 start_codon:yes stop_codon:yes gene_type:complete